MAMFRCGGKEEKTQTISYTRAGLNGSAYVVIKSNSKKIKFSGTASAQSNIKVLVNEQQLYSGNVKTIPLSEKTFTNTKGTVTVRLADYNETSQTTLVLNFELL